MNYNQTNHDEINLIEILKNIWDGKIKIIIIMVISALIAIWYNYKTPNAVQFSIIIAENKDSLVHYPSRKLKTVDISLDFFLDEIIDKKIFFEKSVLKTFKSEVLSKEIISIFKSNEIIKKGISKLGSSDLTLDHNNGDLDRLTVQFIWYNDNDKEIKEIRKILQETIGVAIINTEKLIIEDLRYLLARKKSKHNSSHLEKIEFLKEQSMIAKKLDISDNQVNLSSIDDKSNISVFTNEIYYLRGYRAIDQEISLMKNREFKEFDDIQTGLNNLAKENLELINSDLTPSVRSLTKPDKVLILSILIGVIVGIFYIIFYNAFLSYIGVKEKTK